MRRAQLAAMICAVLAAGAACTEQRPKTSLTFLTRASCVNTDTMRANLDAALRIIGLPADYRVIDADRLPKSDPRHSYATPTVLVGTRDLFGTPEPRTGGHDPT